MGPDDAREQAVIAAGEALRDTGRRFWKERGWRMWVVNESGETVCEIDVFGK